MHYCDSSYMPVAALNGLLYHGFMPVTRSNTTAEMSGKRRTVLLALRDDTEAVKSGIYDQARRAGWRMRDLSHFNLRIPQPCQADGVILRLWPDDIALARRLCRLGVPVVQLWSQILPDNTCCVLPDQRASGHAAARHYADRGFQNMAYLHAENFTNSTFRTLGDSYLERARELGAKAEFIAVQRPGQTVSWTRFGTLARRFKKEISKFSLPLGIFTYHDKMAARICEFCEAIGLSVPEQVAVLGLGNDVNQCDFAPTPLSSLDPNSLEQGRAAAELLNRLMDGGTPPAEPIMIPPAGILTRKSTDVLAMPDIETARGLRYLWEHLGEPLSVGRVADAVGVSRRKLERHFRTHLHRSVNEELVRKRIERACELLTGTDLSIKNVARQIGFSTETYFFRIFRRTMGMTPRTYRRANTTKSHQSRNSGKAGSRNLSKNS